jgi:formamidase
MGLVDVMLCLQVHNLSGPVAVTDVSGEPAHPGDLLMVEICNLGPLPGDEWGFTGTFDRENGGGAVASSLEQFSLMHSFQCDSAM